MINPTRYSVDGGFSVYDLVDEQDVSNIFVEKRPMLAHYCLRIETELAERGIPATVYVGFQRLRRVRPVLSRYLKIAAAGADIRVFGAPDQNETPLPGVRCVALRAGDQLTREWFLVAHHPNFQRALIAREIGAPDLPHAERTFQGVVTGDAAAIARIAQRIDDAIVEKPI